MSHETGTRCAVVAYDSSVLAGTQGRIGTEKVERLLNHAARTATPVIVLADGGGGRPGDLPSGVPARPLEVFRLLGRVASDVPLIGLVTGASFAGNAAMLACCHVKVATADSNVGLGGPVVVDAAGLGTHDVGQIGPVPLLHRLGVIDVVVEDDESAVDAAREVALHLVGASRESLEPPDQRLLRTVLPTERTRAHDVHDVVAVLADRGSLLELGADYGSTVVTAFVRVAGRSLGVVANNPMHGAGALDGAGSDKAARFLRLCDRVELPVLFLCDTPGFAVGPDAEATGQLRRFGELLTAGAQLDVPFGTIVTRKAYGLGAVAMSGASARAPWFHVAWPTAEFSGMSPEATVRLGAARELAAIVDPDERQQEFLRRCEVVRSDALALHAARHFRIDDVIDPATSRDWNRSILLDVTGPPHLRAERA